MKSSKLNDHAIIRYKQAASFSNPATHSSLKEHTGKHFNFLFLVAMFVHTSFYEWAFSPLLLQGSKLKKLFSRHLRQIVAKCKFLVAKSNRRDTIHRHT